MTRIAFLLSYLLFMLPTYVLPYFGSNSLLAQIMAQSSSTAPAEISAVLLTMTALHLFALAVMVLLARARGRVIAKSHLIAFPLVAAAFDMLPLLSMVPLVPTVLHVLALVQGMQKGPNEPA